MASPTRETRIHGSLLAAAEKRLLIRMASAMPAAVNSDHLTVLGAAAMVAAGLCYAAGAYWPPALVLAVVCLAVNWFGDSLDGTLARVRRHERPRYGFYVDHVLDAIGILFVVGGLYAGGFASLLPAAGFLTAYYLLNIEIALATHALGTFRISYWKFGPTELRLLLAAGTLQLLNSPLEHHRRTSLPAVRHRARSRCGRDSRSRSSSQRSRTPGSSTCWSRCRPIAFRPTQGFRVIPAEAATLGGARASPSELRSCEVAEFTVAASLI